MEELQCYKNLEADISACQKPCSGLLVTSYFKSEQFIDVDKLFPLTGAYNRYKKITPNPPSK